MNLVDHDLTEYQITQPLTLSYCTRKWSRQGESDCSHATRWLEQTREIRLFNHPLEQTGNPSVQGRAICANPWSDFMEWIHDEYSVVEKHAQTMLQLLEFGMDWETWRTGADREYSSYSDCGRDHRVEYSSCWCHLPMLPSCVTRCEADSCPVAKPVGSPVLFVSYHWHEFLQCVCASTLLSQEFSASAFQDHELWYSFAMFRPEVLAHHCFVPQVSCHC